MAKEDHLVKFRVENFKRFRNLSVENLGQFNLVIGDNNVGKTSLLEALLFNPNFNNSAFSKNLLYVVKFRNMGSQIRNGHLKLFLNKEVETLSSNVPYILFDLQKRNSAKESFFLRSNSSGFLAIDLERLSEEEKEELFQSTRRFSGEMREVANFFDQKQLGVDYHAPYIPFSLTYSHDLADYYERKIQFNRSLKNSLNDSLAIMIPSIDGFETSKTITDENSIVVYQKDKNAAIPLSFFGDGAIKLFRILMEILSFRGGRLMIDEIDTGIHYSRMKNFWRTILLAAEENEVQLFVTTHNLECIKYFKEALEEMELEHLQKEARTITLVENFKTKDIEAVTSEFLELEHAIEVGNEIR